MSSQVHSSPFSLSFSYMACSSRSYQNSLTLCEYGLRLKVLCLWVIFHQEKFFLMHFRGVEMSFKLISLKGGIWPKMHVKCKNNDVKDKFCTENMVYSYNLCQLDFHLGINQPFWQSTILQAYEIKTHFGPPLNFIKIKFSW